MFFIKCSYSYEENSIPKTHEILVIFKSEYAKKNNQNMQINHILGEKFTLQIFNIVGGKYFERISIASDKKGCHEKISPVKISQ